MSGKAHDSLWGRVQEACFAVVDADSEDDQAYRAARERLRAAAKAWIGNPARPVPPRPAKRKEPNEQLPLIVCDRLDRDPERD